jgi:NurA-like 5'-3' nuclease
MANAEQLNKLDHLDTKELSGKSKEQSEIKTDIDTKIADIAKTEPDASRADLIKQV